MLIPSSRFPARAFHSLERLPPPRRCSARNTIRRPSLSLVLPVRFTLRHAVPRRVTLAQPFGLSFLGPTFWT